MPKLDKKKKVHWKDNSYNDQPKDFQELLSQFKKTKILNFNTVKTQIFSILIKDDYEKILPSYIYEVLPNENIKQEFIKLQGQDILTYLLVCIDDMKIFKVIESLFPAEYWKEIISKEDSKCLKKFLILQSGQEKVCEDNLIVRELRKEKYKFLCSINHQDVKKYLCEIDQRCLSKKMKEDFLQAERELNVGQKLQKY